MSASHHILVSELDDSGHQRNVPFTQPSQNFIHHHFVLVSGTPAQYFMG
jgi:hypothetical protein